MTEILWMMHYSLRALRSTLKEWVKDLSRWSAFWGSYRAYRSSADSQQMERFEFAPYIRDRTSETPIDVTYYYQDAWVFERVVLNKPDWHVDVGSYHVMVSLLSKIVPVTMVDIRPLPVELDSLVFRQGSILAMPYADNSIPSLSSICVIEHIGLGRYGDPLDAKGSAKAIDELKRVLAPSGKLYISVPVGDDEITYFNAARVFRMEKLLKMLQPLVVTDQKFIVGESFQDVYRAMPRWGTTALLELTKMPADSPGSRK